MQDSARLLTGDIPGAVDGPGEIEPVQEELTEHDCGHDLWTTKTSSDLRKSWSGGGDLNS